MTPFSFLFQLLLASSHVWNLLTFSQVFAGPGVPAFLKSNLVFMQLIWLYVQVWCAYLQVKMICSQCRNNLESFSSIKSLLHFMSIMLVQVKPSLCRKTWSCKKVSGTIFFFRLELCRGRFLANMLSGWRLVFYLATVFYTCSQLRT